MNATVGDLSEMLKNETEQSMVASLFADGTLLWDNGEGCSRGLWTSLTRCVRRKLKVTLPRPFERVRVLLILQSHR